MRGQLSPQEKAKPPRFWPSLIMSVMLLALGGGVLWVGWVAIDRQHYEMNWKASGLGGTSSGVLIFDGAAAVRHGIGLTAFGAMLVTWAVGVVIGLARQHSLGLIMNLLIGLTWLSAACLTTASICLFPPWRIPGITFWMVVALVLGFAFALPYAIRKSWRGGFFIGLIGATMACGSINPGAGAGMAIGVLVSLLILVHTILLFPKLEKKLLPDDLTA